MSADQKKQLEDRLEALGPALVAAAEAVVGIMTDMRKGRGTLAVYKVHGKEGEVIGWTMAFRRTSDDDATWT